MKPIVLTDVLAAGEFPTPDQLAILAKAGFKSILNNQPDGEVARFETDAQVAAEAKRQGLVYAYAPLSSRTPPAHEMVHYAKALATLPAPIYAFCYSGSRAAAACALLLTATEEVNSIVQRFDEAGFDLAGLRPWLDDERARHVPPGTARQEAADIPIEPQPVGPTPASGNGANGVNGAAAHATDDQSNRDRKALGEQPGSIIVHPRAAGYGGHAR